MGNVGEMLQIFLFFFFSFVVCQQALFGTIYGESVFPGIVSKLYLPGK